jgi:hypothetical protein
VERPEGMRQLERQRHSWVDNIKIDLERKDVIIWTGLIGTNGGLLCEHGNETLCSIKC